MPNKIVLLLLAVIGLAACEPSGDIDLDELERQNRAIQRQTGGA